MAAATPLPGETLVAWALECGFDRAGIVPLGPSPHAQHFRSWLDRGDAAGMTWLATRRDLRFNPGGLLYGRGRTAISVALHHAPPAEGAQEQDRSLWQGVAAYARGADYHALVRQRLDRLAARIRRERPGSEATAFVDTSPVLERDLAARAGIGAFGKHTGVLHPRAGSWFVLGELVVDFEVAVPTDQETLSDPCGSCTRCLEACPTGALPEPFRLDSRRCISYWTIEHRGPLPPAVRAELGTWVFGCDICQEVCPWNSAPLAGDAELAARPPGSELEPAEVLELDEARWRELFRGSPLRRAKLAGLQRNVTVALGNRGDDSAVDSLARCLATHPDPVVRGHAAWALGRIGSSAARSALLTSPASEPVVSVKGEIAHALAGSPPI